MTDPQKPKLHESFYSVFSAVFSCIMLGLVAYLAYDWPQGEAPVGRPKLPVS